MFVGRLEEKCALYAMFWNTQTQRKIHSCWGESQERDCERRMCVLTLGVGEVNWELEEPRCMK